MSDQPRTSTGPDLTAGSPADSLAEGVPFLGHVQGKPVILVRRGAEIFAVGATCGHSGGPLAEGLVVDDTVRCAWRHACFSLRTGEALCTPALSPVAGCGWPARAARDPGDRTTSRRRVGSVKPVRKEDRTMRYGTTTTTAAIVMALVAAAPLTAGAADTADKAKEKAQTTTQETKTMVTDSWVTSKV